MTSAIADVSDESSVKTLVAATMERFGRIDVLVNNAALFAPLQETKCTEIDVDLGQGHGGQPARAVPDGEARRSAHDRARLWQDHQYRLGQRASRHPLDAALRHQQGRHHGVHAALARELGANGIRVNTLAPGFTLSDTVMNENPGYVQTARDRAVESRSLRRDQHPQDLLGALVFLASADSDFITGQTLAVDGGNVNT